MLQRAVLAQEVRRQDLDRRGRAVRLRISLDHGTHELQRRRRRRRSSRSTEVITMWFMPRPAVRPPRRCSRARADRAGRACRSRRCRRLQARVHTEPRIIIGGVLLLPALPDIGGRPPPSHTVASLRSRMSLLRLVVLGRSRRLDPDPVRLAHLDRVVRSMRLLRDGSCAARLFLRKCGCVVHLSVRSGSRVHTRQARLLVHHLAERGMREHRVHQLGLGGLERLARWCSPGSAR